MKAKEDATALMRWSEGEVGPDLCFSSAEGLGLAQVTV